MKNRLCPRRVIPNAMLAVILLTLCAVTPAVAQTDALHVTPEGKVGIGTTNPWARLDVRGASISEGIAVRNTQANSQAQVVLANDARTWVLRTDTNDYFRVRDSTSTTDRMTIDTSGNVGIGTSNPAGKLDVNGAIFQTGGQIHPDFVFEPEYQLETIEDHSAYMWANKHLPAVGAGKYDEDGRSVIELGANSTAMLEELEKAHIYIEQLNTSLKASQAENVKLRQRLARIEQVLGLVSR